MKATESGEGFPEVRVVGAAAPLVWVAKGWADLRACPLPALAYGICFAAMGLVLTLVFRHAVHYTSGLVTGFLLLGPFLSMGLYELSRRRERGERCALAPSLAVWRRNAGNIGVYCVVLIVLFLLWGRASLVTFALFYTNELPSLTDFLGQVLRLQNLQFLAVYFGVGLLFATLVFAASVVSIPMMLDRDQDAITAVLASFAALLRNPGAMTLWAGLIAALTALGFATAFVGLVVTVPIIGHATWHAYRDLVA